MSRANVKQRLVALTFDDGPSRNLHSILAMLDKYDAHATFFIVSSYITTHGQWVQDIATQGSEVGNHTATHLQLDTASPDQIASELDQSQETIRQYLGQAPQFMRPPVGKYNQQVLEAAKKRNLPVILWSIHSQDTGDGGADSIANNVLASAGPGDIILMHELGKQTLKALPAILSKLTSQGYKIVTVGQLLNAGNVP